MLIHYLLANISRSPNFLDHPWEFHSFRFHRIGIQFGNQFHLPIHLQDPWFQIRGWHFYTCSWIWIVSISSKLKVFIDNLLDKFSLPDLVSGWCYTRIEDKFIFRRRFWFSSRTLCQTPGQFTQGRDVKLSIWFAHDSQCVIRGIGIPFVSINQLMRESTSDSDNFANVVQDIGSCHFVIGSEEVGQTDISAGMWFWHFGWGDHVEFFLDKFTLHSSYNARMLISQNVDSHVGVRFELMFHDGLDVIPKL